MIEQAKFTYSPVGKAFGKQIKTMENQREKGKNDGKHGEILELRKKINYDDLMYYFKGKNIREKSFDKKKN